MSFHSSSFSRCCAWFLPGLFIVALGCSPSSDDGAGSSGSGAGTGGKPAAVGENPGAPTNPSGLTFGPADSTGDVVPVPPTAPPEGNSKSNFAAPSAPPVTLPPDVSLPETKPVIEKPKGTAAKPKAGEIVPEVPKKAE